jgi:hypothetical protein
MSAFIQELIQLFPGWPRASRKQHASMGTGIQRKKNRQQNHEEELDQRVGSPASKAQ